MDNKQLTWERLSASYLAYAEALRDFKAQDVDRVGLMKGALRGEDRIIAIYHLRYLPQSELLHLFDELVYLSSFSHGSVGAVRQIILAMPKDWVLSNIETSVEPILETGTYDEYRRLLELYWEMDRGLTLSLAQRAKKHEDSDIREVGDDFINMLDE